MNDSKETACSKCTKRNVCKYKEDYLVAIEAYVHIKIPDLFSFKLDCRERDTGQHGFKR